MGVRASWGGFVLKGKKPLMMQAVPRGSASSNPGEGGEVPGTIRHSRRDGSITGTSC